MRRRKHLVGVTHLLVTLITLWLPSIGSADPTRLHKGEARYTLGPNSQYLEDPTGTATLSDLRQPDTEGKLKPVAKEVPTFGFSESTFWLVNDFDLEAGLPDRWLLHIAYPLLDNIEVHIIFDDGTITSFKAGDLQPFAARPVDHRHFVFPMSLNNHRHLRLYVRVQTSSSVQIPMTLWQERAFFESEQRTIIGLGLFFGILLVMILYNLFIYLSIRDISYLYYVLFVAGMAGFLMTLHGVSYQFLWPHNPGWHARSTVVTLPSGIAFSALFTDTFLQLQSRSPRLSRTLRVFAGLAFTAILAAFAAPYAIMIRLEAVLVMTFSLTVCFSGVIRWLAGDKPARYFMIAWFSFLIGAILNSANKLGAIPRTFVTENGAAIGSVLGVVLLSLALADRLSELQAQKRAAEQRSESLEEERDVLLRVIEQEQKMLADLQDQRERTHANLKHAQTQLVQAEKLSSLGQLVAGVAHDIASPVNYIGDCRASLNEWSDAFEKELMELVGDDPDALEVAQDFQNKFTEMRDLLDDIRVGSDKLHTLNHALRNYSRLDAEPTPGVVLDEVIDEALVILDSRVKLHRVSTSVDDIPALTCHRSHIGQVLTNLIANASDELESIRHERPVTEPKFIGEILIRVRRAVHQDQAGVTISVEDNGPGIPQEIRDKILEAFYTTKPAGKGTGLGLAICSRIISDHSGTLSIARSEELGGASFEVWLPA